MATAVDTLRKDAELVVDVCMSVEPDDVVTIICDDDHRDQADAVASVCVERGAWPVIMNNEAQVVRGRADTHFPMAPPRNLHTAMTSSDEVIILTNLEWANRFAHVNAVRETCAANGKIASVEEGMGDWELTRTMIEEATQRARDAMAALEGKTLCRVTSAKGTDLTVSIEGRPALEVTPIKTVDRVKVGRGRRGPVTEAIQQRFFQIVRGDGPDTHGWLQFVNSPAAAGTGGPARTTKSR